MSISKDALNATLNAITIPQKQIFPHKFPGNYPFIGITSGSETADDKIGVVDRKVEILVTIYVLDSDLNTLFDLSDQMEMELDIPHLYFSGFDKIKQDHKNEVPVHSRTLKFSYEQTICK